MTFISYAQNFEDVMLWRALKHVQNGTYVDVGAQHPVVDSVSKAFYEHGWRGIHIEPVPKYADLLRKDRPDETVLQVALADTEDTLELNVISDTGLSTAVDAYAERHQVERGFELQRVQVPVLTLKSALKSLVGKDVHWLKIDVEGLEEKVLKGWDSQTLRPWVMVIEATIPNSPETDYASWEPILTAANYQFVYFDGLNRFYVSQEHTELAGAFSCPPNVFDGVELSGLATWGLCRRVIASHQGLVSEAEARHQSLQIEWDAAKDRAETLHQLTVRLEGELNAERQHSVQFGDELQEAKARESRMQEHTEWLTAHAKRLQSELDAASAKVSELDQRAHYLSSLADGISQTLQSVYASMSWRITWPLRRALLMGMALASPPKRAVVWALRQRQRPTHVSDEQDANLKGHANTLQIELGSAKQQVENLDAELSERSDIGMTARGNQAELPTAALSPSAAWIYAKLQKAIEERQH